MSKKLLVFAQEAEALPTIKALDAQMVEGERREIYSEGLRPSCYAFSSGWIILTDMGILNASLAVTKYLIQFGNAIDEVINLGLAASLHDHANIGEIYEIGHVGKYTHLPKEIDLGSKECCQKILPPIPFATNTHSLLSVDFPLHDPLLKKELQKEWDLVDMEGYGIVFAAQHFNKKVRLYKVISDFAKQGGRELIKKHKESLAHTLANKVLSKIKKSQRILLLN